MEVVMDSVEDKLPAVVTVTTDATVSETVATTRSNIVGMNLDQDTILPPHTKDPA